MYIHRNTNIFSQKIPACNRPTTNYSHLCNRLGYVADFRCRRCLDGDSAQVVLSSEVELEPGVKVECVSKFCYLGDTLGSGGV